MEEKKKEEKKSQKLTYEQLEAYTEQVIAQAKKLYKENQELIQEVKTLKGQTNFAEINLAFRVLEFRECFDDDFVKVVRDRLEEVLYPVKQEENKNPE